MFKFAIKITSIFMLIGFIGSTANADFDSSILTFEKWVNSVQSIDSTLSDVLLQELNSMSKNFATRTDEYGLSHSQDLFTDTLVEKIKSGRLHADFKGWSLNDLTELTLCIEMQKNQWKSQCLFADERPYEASCQTKQGAIPVELGSDCETVYVTPGPLLGKGLESQVLGAFRIETHAPWWTSIAKRIPNPPPRPDGWPWSTLLDYNKGMLDEWVRKGKIEDTAAARLEALKKSFQEATTTATKRRSDEFKIFQELSKIPGLYSILEGTEKQTYHPRFDLDLKTAHERHSSAQKDGEAPSIFRPFAREQIFRMIIRQIEIMHHHGFIHRDVKPANILVKGLSNPLELEAKLNDFGLSFHAENRLKAIADQKALAERYHHTRVQSENRIAGTKGYLAPEQVEKKLHGSTKDEKSAAAKAADIFALAMSIIVIYDFQPDEVRKLKSCQSLEDSCRPKIANLRNALANNQTIDTRLRNLLVSSLDSNPFSRPTISKFKSEFYKYSVWTFCQTLFGLASCEKRSGTQFFSEDPETGALRPAAGVDPNCTFTVRIRVNPFAQTSEHYSECILNSL